MSSAHNTRQEHDAPGGDGEKTAIAALSQRLLEAQQEGLEANALRWLRFRGTRPGEVVEMQVLNVPSGDFSRSYFAHAATAEDLVRLLDEAESFAAPGIYVLANEVNPDVALRAPSGAWHPAKKGSSTTDDDIVSRRVLYVDIDAERTSGTSATDEEVARALTISVEIYQSFANMLGGEGALGLGMSGNGGSVFVALADLPPTVEITSGIKEILTTLDRLVEMPGVKIDKSVCDLKRLVPAWGTWKRKGVDSESRPHRPTAFVCADVVERVDGDGLCKILDGLKAMLPKVEEPRAAEPAAGRRELRSNSPQATSTGPFDRANACDVREVAERLDLLEGEHPRCPGCGSGGDSSVAFVNNGLKCMHARCAEKGIAGFRTPVDLVVEAKGFSPHEAARTILRWFDDPAANASSASSVVRAERTSTFVRGDHVELAERLVDDIRRERDVVFAEGAFYAYHQKSGLWRQLGEDTLSRIIQRYAGAPCGSAAIRLRAGDIHGTIKLAAHQVTDADYFADARSGLAFTNGFLTVAASGVTLGLHDPGHRARSGYEFAFDPQVKPSAWHAFLDSLFAGDADRQEKTAFIQQFCGVAILGLAPRYQKAVVLLGGGANGKSKLAEVIEAAMPRGSTSSIAPQLWGGEYNRAELSGKLLNNVAELPAADIIHSQDFKAIVTGEPVQGRPIREAPFTFRPKAAHVFSANALPGTIDQSEGFWRRFTVIEFNNKFTGASADPAIADRIIANELQGIVRWMIEGAVEVLRNGRLVEPPSSTNAVDAWRRQADQVRSFLDEKTEALLGGAPTMQWTQAAVLYAAYRRWATENGHQLLAANKFGRRVETAGVVGTKTRNGKVYRLRLRLGGAPA